MKLLDCSTIATTIDSLKSALGVSAHLISERLLRFDPGGYWGDRQGSEASRVLMDLFPERPGKIPYSGVAWFHLTRTIDPSRFAKGILPASQALDGIWEDLGGLVRDNAPGFDWAGFRQSVETDHPGEWAKLYRLKQKPNLSGPYALLLREPVIGDVTPDNHYLRCPESIVDICEAFGVSGGFDLKQAFCEASSAVVVKFFSPQVNKSHIGTALWVARNCLNLVPYHFLHNDVFDGGGAVVTPDRILDVEFIQVPEPSNQPMPRTAFGRR